MNLTQCGLYWLLCWGILSQTAQAAPNEEQLLQAETIFQLSLGRQVISDGLFAYQLSDQSYLPLGELTRILEFPIMLGPDGQRAEGWFISPQQTFSLNLYNKILQIRGKKRPYQNKGIFSSEEEIYVSTQHLKDWFGLSFDISLAALNIALSSKQPLPIQQRAERDKRYGSFRKGFTLKPKLPYTLIPYQLIAIPAASINLNSDYRQQNNLTSSAYSAQLHGDLFYHTGKLFLSGDDQQGIKNLRLQLGKDDFNGQLLGPLKANRYRLGDITVQSRALIGGNFSGRGFQFSSIPINQSSEFNRITLEGDLQPEYDVELYRNGGLYEFQRASDTGRYKFENVPLFQGMNVLKLVFYGPQGQQYEKIQRLYSDGATAKQGQLNYRFSLTQPNQSLFNVGDTLNDQSIAWLASASYGLGRSLSATASLAQYEQEQEQQSYANLGLRGTFGALLLQSEMSLDKNGNTAGVAGLQTEWGSLRMDLSHKQYSREFVSNGIDPLQQSNSLRLEGTPIRLGDRASTSLFNINLSQSQQFSGRTATSVNHNFWLSVGYMSLSNDLRYQENSNSSNTTLNGSARISFNADKIIKGFNLRSNVDYSIDPEQLTQNASLGANYRFDKQRNFSFSATRNYQQDNKIVYYSLGYNHRFDALNLGTTLSGGTQDDLYIGVKLSFSVLPDPVKKHPRFYSSTAKAQEGSVLAISYIDRNHNGKYDFWEQKVSDIGFMVNRGYRPGRTNRHGKLLISGLNTSNKVDIQLNPSTVGDPYLIPSSDGYGITPRAGHIMRLEFPLISIGEIDGHVYLLRDSEKIEAANVSLELVNAETGSVVTILRSEYDGYFYLPNVIPGKYQLQVEPHLIKRLGLSAPPAFDIEIHDDGDSITTPDLILKRLKKPNSIEPLANRNNHENN